MSTIILQIKKTNDTMEELTEMTVNRTMEHKITKKLLAIILVFAIKSILNFIFLFLFTRNGNGLFLSLFDLFTVLNCGVNVIIYGIFDKKFRKIISSRFKNDDESTIWITKSNNQESSLAMLTKSETEISKKA